MKDLKFTPSPWWGVFAHNETRAVRDSGGLICTIRKPSRYIGQDERYDHELEEVKNNQSLIAMAPDLYELCKQQHEALKKCANEIMAPSVDLQVFAALEQFNKIFKT